MPAEEVQCLDVGTEVVAGSDSQALCHVIFHYAVQEPSIAGNLVPSLTWSTAGDNPLIRQSSSGSNSSYVWYALSGI